MWSFLSDASPSPSDEKSKATAAVLNQATTALRAPSKSSALKAPSTSPGAAAATLRSPTTSSAISDPSASAALPLRAARKSTTLHPPEVHDAIADILPHVKAAVSSAAPAPTAPSDSETENEDDGTGGAFRSKKARYMAHLIGKHKQAMQEDEDGPLLEARLDGPRVGHVRAMLERDRGLLHHRREAAEAARREAAAAALRDQAGQGRVLRDRSTLRGRDGSHGNAFRRGGGVLTGGLLPGVGLTDSDFVGDLPQDNVFHQAYPGLSDFGNRRFSAPPWGFEPTARKQDIPVSRPTRYDGSSGKGLAAQGGDGRSYRDPFRDLRSSDRARQAGFVGGSMNSHDLSRRLARAHQLRQQYKQAKVMGDPRRHTIKALLKSLHGGSGRTGR